MEQQQAKKFPHSKVNNNNNKRKGNLWNGRKNLQNLYGVSDMGTKIDMKINGIE
jgi:hypothetical protein